ncbi:hypothetical protein QYM36_019334 [Artemia franciscana]|uniref:Uncharacterized protein n=1 Tax=Artemia franciscana TaxID=6661 RepID=A0AA88H1C3_ARTSF|nr:hypothetical protein QYM36_019334 [Artemia franciscana]
MCAGSELFYTMFYLLYFTEGPLVLCTDLFRILVHSLHAHRHLQVPYLQSYKGILQWENLSGLDIQERQQLKEKFKNPTSSSLENG